MDAIEQTISQVEKLYENVTGKCLKDQELRHEPISAEIDPFALLSVRLEHLLMTLDSPVVQRQLAPITPPLSAWENESHYLLRLEVPGVEKEDIDISVRGNLLIISGRRKPLDIDKGFQPKCIESMGGMFQRVITMPVENFNAEINSNLKNGILDITLSKTVGTTKSSYKKGKAQ